MKRLSCADVSRRVSAFCDGELPIEEQVTLGAHLRVCAACSSTVAEFRDLGDALRAGTAAMAAIRADALHDMQADVLSRLRVEREESVPAQVSRAFEDMRLGFAALGSTVATVVSILLIIGIFYFGPRGERPDSLAGMMETLGANSAGTDSRVLMPRTMTADGVSASLPNDGDAVFALSAIVTRNGRVANLELVLSEQPTGADRERVMRLLDQVSRARFEPARMDGSPVAVKTVFLVAHTTVRAKMPVTPKQSAMPAAQRSVQG
jgi:anti-sigma factor RsiW